MVGVSGKNDAESEATSQICLFSLGKRARDEPGPSGMVAAYFRTRKLHTVDQYKLGVCHQDYPPLNASPTTRSSYDREAT